MLCMISINIQEKLVSSRPQGVWSAELVGFFFMFLFCGILHTIQLTPQKLSAGRVNPQGCTALAQTQGGRGVVLRVVVCGVVLVVRLCV